MRKRREERKERKELLPFQPLFKVQQSCYKISRSVFSLWLTVVRSIEGYTYD